MRRGNLCRGLRGLHHGFGQRANRFARFGRLLDTGLDRLAALFRGQHGGRGGLLNIAQDGAHLRGGLLGLLGQAFYFLRDDGEAFALVAGLGRLDGGIDRERGSTARRDR